MADFKLGFSLDTSELNKGKKALEDVATAAGLIANSEGKRKQAHDSADAALNKTTNGTKQAEASAQRYIQSIKMEDQALKAFNQSQKTINTALEQGKLNAQQHARYIKEMGDAYKNAKKEAEAFRDAGQGGGGDQAGSQFEKLLAALRNVGNEGGNLGSILSGAGGLGGSMEGLGALATRLGAALGPVGIGIAVVAGAAAAAGIAFKSIVLPLAEVQDKFASYKGQIDLVLQSTGATDEMFSRIVAGANDAGISIDTAATAFTRILRNAEDIGASADQVAQLTETVQKLGIISRTGQGEMQGAMIQLSQALAAGKLNGDELRSIMENMPALAKAIADGLGVSVGQLRRMGAEGELTSAKVFEALLGQQKKVNEEFEKMPQTTAQAFARMENQSLLLKNKIAEMFNATGIAQGVANMAAAGIKGIYDFLDDTTAERTKRINADIELNRLLLANASGRQANLLRERIQLLEGERAAINAAAKAEEARKAGQKTEDANNSRDAQIRQAVEAVKAAGYDKEAQERKKLTQENKSYVDQLAAAMKAREELKQKNIDAAKAEAAAFAAVGLAIEAMRKAMASGNPLAIAVAANKQFIAKAQMGAAKGRTEELASETDTNADNIRILEKGVQGTLSDLKKIGQTKSTGGSKGVSSLTSLKRTVGDLERALASGALGGGVDMLTQSYAAERDAKGSGSQTRDLLEKQRALQAEQNIASIQRQTKQQDELTAAVGKSRTEIAAIEIAQKAYNYEVDTFGKATSPAAKKAVEAYTKAMRDQAAATERASGAQKVLSAQQQVGLSSAMLAAGPDRTAQDKARFEFQLQQDLKEVSDPTQRKTLEDTRRLEFRNQELLKQQQIKKSQQDELAVAEERYKLAGLSTKEYDIQLRLLQKRRELESQGIDVNSGFGAETMAREEDNARRGQVLSDLEDRKQRFVKGWEKAADDVGGLLSNAFDDAYTKGLKSAGSNFLTGMGAIFKQLGNDLVYELAVRPVQELIKNLASQALQKLLFSVFGAIGGGVGSGTSGSNMAGVGASAGLRAANGAAFGSSGYRAFAGGGAFTNTIVSRPTMFAFAGGTGLMGEAGPEAIMPLKRGANGKLGIEGGGGGDTTIIVNDMRSSPSSKPVETSEKRGPDGKRMISMLIRDEVRRQIRSGDLDREMGASYGATRTIARK